MKEFKRASSIKNARWGKPTERLSLRGPKRKKGKRYLARKKRSKKERRLRSADPGAHVQGLLEQGHRKKEKRGMKERIQQQQREGDTPSLPGRGQKNPVPFP